jgi:diguanylate cyclase (GGDEF)-like protein
MTQIESFADGVVEVDTQWTEPKLGEAIAAAEAVVRAGELAEGEQRLARLLVAAEQLGSKGLMGECWRIRALAQSWRGDLGGTQASSLKAIALLEEAERDSSLAQALSIGGSNLARIGEPTEGLEYINRAVELAQASGDRVIQSRVLGNLGIYYSLTRNYERAIEATQAAIDLQRPYSDHWLPLMNLGALYLESAAARQGPEAELSEQARHELQSSYECSLQAEAHFAAVDIGPLRAVCIGNMGVALLRLGRLEEAQVKLEEERQISARGGYRDTEEEALGYLGVLALRRGDHAQAEQFMKQALSIAEENHERESIGRAWLNLSNLREAMGDFREALNCFRRYHEVTQSRLAEQAEARAEAFAVKLEIERARLGAELHRLRAAELTATNQKLEAEAKLLDRYANEDSLTGLANRRFLNAALAKAFAQSVASDNPMTVAIIDVDHFKAVNDTFSHAIGDQVLQALARILTTQCRGRDLVARLGGEEFVVIFDAESANDALPVSERMRSAVERFDWASLDTRLSVTVSIGLASRTDQSAPEQLLASADSALYDAKRAGRNCVRVFKSGDRRH